jgi:hypothetical protein
MPLQVWTRSADPSRRPYQRTDALLRLHTGNTTGTTPSSTGVRMMQHELFASAQASPINGLKLKLERKVDGEKGCCRNFAVVHAGKGPHVAELRCANCGAHRGWLPKQVASWLLNVLAVLPDARTDVHVIRDTPATSARGGTGQSQARDRGKQR